MGYRGLVAEQNRARELRAGSWTLQEIATELGVARGSVSRWVRDVEFTPKPRSTARRRGPNALQRAKQAEIDQLLAEGRERSGRISDKEFLVAGTALYAGEGAKTDGSVTFANSDPRMIAFFCAWLRHFFEVDEARLHFRLYLHDGLDLNAAFDFWESVTDIPRFQFSRPYRAIPDPSIRTAKHVYGCPAVRYACSRTHRAVMGLVHGLLACDLADPG
jgi:transcriptional regulator with XRE-family HTH domain